MSNEGGHVPLIPASAALTIQVLQRLSETYGTQINGLKAELPKDDIETILSRVRSLSAVIGSTAVHGLDANGYEKFGQAICDEIGKIVDVRLPKQGSAYSNLVNWITGVARDYPIEVFTTNYDLLFEEAFEAVQAPYFDGFTGAKNPFFDPVSIAKNDLPARWTRLWKLHGSLGWASNVDREIVRTGQSSATHLVFPEHMKYDQTQKAPYVALFDRLRAFLSTPDTLLISIGSSFADAHVTARIDDALAGNPSASVFAFQYRSIGEEGGACELAKRRPNFSVYSPDQAMVNGTIGRWVVSNELPSKDWGPIRATYWAPPEPGQPNQFMLGGIEAFAKFFAASRSMQIFGPASVNPSETNGSSSFTGGAL